MTLPMQSLLSSIAPSGRGSPNGRFNERLTLPTQMILDTDEESKL